MFDGARGRMQECCAPAPRGTWCSGITSASHAEGPGFKSQCVHFPLLFAGACFLVTETEIRQWMKSSSVFLEWTGCFVFAARMSSSVASLA